VTRLRSALWLPLFDDLADPLVAARLAGEAEQAGWDGFFGLLLQGARPAEVATAVGFYDQAHFTRHFKKHTSTTPARSHGRQ
jgi:AraC-like DNA-binding protein